MATDLYIISNIKTSKEEVVRNKDIYLKKLKALGLGHISICQPDNSSKKLEGDWTYEFDEDIYDEETLKELGCKELIYYNSPFEFDVSLFEGCLEISTIYKYIDLYDWITHDGEYYKGEFRNKVFEIISIFGGTEVIYLADNGCDKLSSYLELKVWEGVSYDDVKNEMKQDNVPFRNDFDNLISKELSYSNISEYLYDDFSDLIIKPK